MNPSAAFSAGTSSDGWKPAFGGRWQSFRRLPAKTMSSGPALAYERLTGPSNRLEF